LNFCKVAINPVSWFLSINHCLEGVGWLREKVRSDLRPWKDGGTCLFYC
jgi:hypothetical protein